MAGDGNSLWIEFQPAGRKIELEQGASLLDAARAGGFNLLAVCGGIGICKGCKVILISGRATPPTAEENQLFTNDEILQGYRLACQAVPLQDCVVEIPPESLSTLQRLQVEGVDILHQDESRLTIQDIPLDEVPENTLDEIKKKSNFFVDKEQHGIRLVQKANEFMAVFPAGTSVFGLAVDMGTTKLAGYLVDLQSGITVARTGLMNPQAVYGDDVISRISYANISSENYKHLQTSLLNAIWDMTVTLAREVGAQTNQIVDSVLAGNTVMQHLAAGRPVASLGEAPYKPDRLDAEVISSGDLGWEFSQNAQVYMPPNIAGYVGGDHVAMCLATGAYPPHQDILALDIGTNTEITLCANGNAYSCSCASGPAFEGARIQMGMRAVSGAIEKVQLSDGKILYSTIDNLPAVGICGSGILDAIAMMLADGAIYQQGKLIKEHHRVVQHGHIRGYELVSAEESGIRKPILINARDVHEIQLAKAAIRTGIDILMKEANYDPVKLHQFVVAGAFGTYLDIESAVRIGMFPKLDRKIFSQVGNAAGMGAGKLLISTKARKLAEQIASQAHYVELTSYPGFMDIYIQNLLF